MIENGNLFTSTLVALSSMDLSILLFIFATSLERCGLRRKCTIDTINKTVYGVGNVVVLREMSFSCWKRQQMATSKGKQKHSFCVMKKSGVAHN